ncbi:MAG: transcription-repair coupling factor [Chitinophagales bacterium]|jgi:transcription-repair coupling factor (superfamily II helicase)|nr:transcription-repair coupling factor [Bacteroidota bacterium]MBL0278785.1 transcription-repair coupling factor [Bacteroidota bacterium]MBP8248488.1 transcription-repair coupling factor [Chitinophagales bacterium]MBP9880073.1 transcription-repair coupling factor [Chitinophagales bacterium]
MDLQELLTVYREQDDRIKAFTGQIATAQKPINLHLKGIAGSLLSFVVSGVYKNLQHNHLFILNDKEEAGYFLNDLETLLNKKDILFIPDSFKKETSFEEVNTNSVLLRTEAINKITNSHTRGEIIVTYPEALVEKFVVAEVLKENIILLKKGEKLDDHFIIDLLAENGFERTDFVYEPGQFSVRGGIIDIFSFGNEMPYRVELYDDEVESIRVFDPTTQISEKTISQVTIIPNIQTQFGAEQKSSLFHSLPKNTIVWFKDAKYTFEVINKVYEKALDWYEITKKEKLLDRDHPFNKYPPEELLLSGPALLEEVPHFSAVEFGLHSNLPDTQIIQFDAAPQPLFNRNFEQLIQKLKEFQSLRYHLFIFMSNARQAERFHEIFTDLNAQVKYLPIIPVINEDGAASTTIAAGFIDNDKKIVCFTDHQIFERHHKYTVKSGFSKTDAITLKTLMELRPGDFVTHIDHGVGVYSGLEKIEIGGQIQEAVRLIYRDNDLLYVNINSLHKISKYAGKEGTQPKLNKIGSDAWEQLKRKTKAKVKDIAKDLIALYAKRKSSKGFAYSPDGYLQNELEASFIYEDTPDQYRATVDVKRDMEKPHPMDRLVCGDVGFGKTEIAIRAAFKAVTDGKQVAVLVPTTILASQHFKTFSERLKEFPVTVDYINRFKSDKDKKTTLEKLEAGKVDILVGTHAIIGKKIKFKDLGLLIIDEEQKFGVTVKEKLRAFRANIDTLTLTATPIPRTLQFSMMGARDLSIINTPPPNRQPIQTELKTFDAEFIRDAIYQEIYRGGQVYFIHNRVRDIQETAALIKKVCPDLNIGVAHGQLEGEELEDHMLKFIDKTYDVLVCTNIVESGLDIPNANTIIINNAHWFGLSDLHQLRGRVGRSNKKAYCYLISPPLFGLPDDSRKRLRTIEQFADLGSGFQISMRDLDIRGAGNLLGAEQSGFISEIGFDMYHKILDEAIRELKQTQFKALFAEQIEEKQEYVRDVQIDTDLEMLIPDAYITNINERMSIYTRLDNVANEVQITQFKNELTDRFGKVPRQVEELFNGIRLRWLAKDMGLERIIFKSRKLRCYFVENPESVFYDSPLFHNIMQLIAQKKTTGIIKQTDKHLILIFEQVQSMSHARQLLQNMHQNLFSPAPKQ